MRECHEKHQETEIAPTVKKEKSNSPTKRQLFEAQQAQRKKFGVGYTPKHYTEQSGRAERVTSVKATGCVKILHAKPAKTVRLPKKPKVIHKRNEIQVAEQDIKDTVNKKEEEVQV